LRVSREELLLTQTVRNVQNISKLESALLYSQGPAASPHPEAEKFRQILFCI